MDWRTVEKPEAGHSSLFTLQNNGECRRQTKEKEKGKGKGKSSAAVGTTEANGERELLSTDGRRSFFFSSVFALLLRSFLWPPVYKNKQSRNIALWKACRNSFYKTEFWPHFMVGAMHENYVLFCSQIRWNHDYIKKLPQTHSQTCSKIATLMLVVLQFAWNFILFFYLSWKYFM